MPASAGTQIGPYEIISCIGAGGMGEVYRAKDTRLGRDVAIKILPQQFAQDENRLSRFKQEARSASALNHPNIITIYEIGSFESGIYISMELIEGKTLREILNSGRLPLRKTMHVAAQLADGLAKAHETGIIHRDLKPENFMINKDGFAKILDFGLVKISLHKSEEVRQLPTQPQTNAGIILGTCAYMSPEQAAGEPVDFRSDQFSFGTILYEATTGKHPFFRKTTVETLSAIMNDEAEPLGSLNPQLPLPLQWIIERCMAKNREDRYASTKDLAKDLRNVRDRFSELKSSGESVAIDRKKKKISSMVGIISGVVLVVVLGFLAWKRIENDKIRPARPFEKIKITRLTTTGKAVESAISPDGKYIVYVGSVENNKKAVWLRQIATGTDIQILPPAADYWGVTISPDGQFVYYLSEYTNKIASLYRIPLLGGISRKILENVDSPITFSNDGKKFAFVRGPLEKTTLLLSTIDGKVQNQLSSRKFPSHFTGAAWSPDGKFIACISAESIKKHLILIEVQTGKEQPFSELKWESEYEDNLVWQRSMKGLILRAAVGEENDQIWYIEYPQGKFRRITNDLNHYKHLSLTADDRQLVTRQTEFTSTLWISDLKGAFKQISYRPNAMEGSMGIAWLADESILYTARVGSDTDLWKSMVGGDSMKQITVDSGNNLYPQVCDQGRYIVFMSDRNTETFHIWRMEYDGSNAKQLTYGSGERFPKCSLDGKWVIYAAPRSKDALETIWKVPLAGGKEEPITTRTCFSPAISPDGQSIACTDDPNLKIAIIDFESGMTKKLFDLPADAFTSGRTGWTADGRGLTYLRKNNIWLQPMDGSASKPLTNFDDQVYFYDWSKDGKKLAVSRGSIVSNIVLIEQID